VPVTEVAIEVARVKKGRAPVAGVPRKRRLAPGSPGAVGTYIGMVFGVGLLVLGISSGFRAEPLPVPLIIALCLAGVLEALLCWQTLARSRVAWSFAVTLSGTAGLVCLFGAPKIRDVMGVSFFLAMLPVVVAASVTILLGVAAEDVAARSSD